MGQFFIVQGRRGAPVEPLFAETEQIFAALFGAFPAERLLDPANGIAVAKYDRSSGRTSRITSAPSNTAWACGAGTFFLNGQSGDAALQSLVERWSRDPAAVLRDLDGMFALIHCEPSSRLLEVLTDRLGILHLFKAEKDSCVILSTSSMALAALLQPAWDDLSCREFLATGSVFDNRTLFQGVEKLPAATIIRYEEGQERRRTRYWSLANFEYTREDAVPRLASALESAFQTIQSSYKKPALDLTGGFDSRVLVGIAMRTRGSIDTVVTGPDTERDVVVSKLIAREFDLPHQHHVPESLTPHALWESAKASLLVTDGECDVFEYAHVLETQESQSRQFDIGINGSNGAMYKGYWWQSAFPFTGWRGHFSPERFATRRLAAGCEPEGLLQGSFPDTLPQHFAELIRLANKGLERHPNTAQIDNVYLRLRLERWQGRLASSTNRVAPNVSPLAFREPMEAALTATPPQRVRGRLPRRLLQYLNPRLAALPLAQGYPAMPLRLTTCHRFGPLAVEVGRAVLKRLGTRSPAIPHVNSYRDLWSVEEAREVLNPGSMLTIGLYKPASLTALFADVRNTYSRQIHSFRRVVTLELLAERIRDCAAH